MWLVSKIEIGRAFSLRDFLYAGPIVLLFLALYTYWFAIADRYAIFLYQHLGAGPFDTITSSRYWMTGLVAAGATMVLLVLFNWFAGRVGDRRGNHYCPPPWWRIWLLAAPALALGIPFITMTQNQPTLPPTLALQCTLVALIGLALALMPDAMAANQISELAWLTLFGLGFVPALLLLRVVELPARGFVETRLAAVALVTSLLAPLLWLGLLSWLRARRGKPAFSASGLFIAGLVLSYLLLPLYHYLFMVPSEYRYISAATNFFAYTPWVQLASLLLAILLASGFAKLQRHLCQ